MDFNNKTILPSTMPPQKSFIRIHGYSKFNLVRRNSLNNFFKKPKLTCEQAKKSNNIDNIIHDVNTYKIISTYISKILF